MMTNELTSSDNDGRVDKAMEDYPDWLTSRIKTLDWVDLFKMLDRCVSNYGTENPIEIMASYFGIERRYNGKKHMYEYVDKEGNILK